MRVVFIGATRFGLRCLSNVAEIPECDLAGIVTAPEVFQISYRPSGVRNVLHADLHPFAAEHGLDVFLMRDKMTDPALVDQIRAWRPDFILVVGWYHMIPRSIRAIAPTAGLHASLLPDYSGNAPLVWAIINGEKQTGITFFFFEDGVDAGDIIGQSPESIFPDDTIATLYDRIEQRGVELLRACLPRIARGEAVYTPQDESKRRIMPQRSPEDGEIDWTASADKIYDFIRAQTRPYPGAFTYAGGEKLAIWRAQTGQTGSTDAKPGTVVSPVPGSPEVAGVQCGDGRLLLIEEATLGDDAGEGPPSASVPSLTVGMTLGRDAD